MMNLDQPRIISLQDLALMTLRANVAFAVRCAQRVRPCFELPADLPRRREHMAAVDAAIRVATAYCLGQPLEAGRTATATRAAMAAAEETYEMTFAAYAAARAAAAAASAEAYLSDPNGSPATEVVAYAFGAARVVSANVDSFSQPMVVAALYADVQYLLKQRQGSVEKLGPPVDPSESGPLGSLWPAGVPLCYERGDQPSAG